ncbi:glutamyl-tRNA amidotransferase [Ruminococcus bicirculans (ex Wegman et al. 2014)]|uniref:glutamyl-tRNA amidotransferase n=1 Tax=Ruminococcus bicirculans (ex Wegman et al. 2014) TaxID=1160721 RepID=UPI002672FA62
MCVVIPDCTSCKNFKGKNKNGLFYCSAFPQGIPKKYFWGNIPVRNISECANKIRFEEIYD